MEQEEFNSLQRGDIVRHKNHAESMIVMSHSGSIVIVAITQAIHNPDEWDLIFKANHERRSD